MQTSGNTVLITGGASGIGLALAERFLKADNKVLICGRRADKLQEAKDKHPQLYTKVCDIANADDRIALAKWVAEYHPTCNVLINNAGIQQRVELESASEDWAYYQNEIAANFEAPVHLATLLLPQLRKQPHGAIINVSSGLAITPGAWVPIYSATKAALHSFTVSLRIQLARTNVEVIEVLPPAVNTDLGGAGLHTFGAPIDEFADSVFSDLSAGKQEVGFGGTSDRLELTALEAKEAARKMYEGFTKRSLLL
ncbi:putative oxidoreductase [Paenibacillus phyllosphaerae]|uniref:Putative oxidoreductase n=1 Tax=Paenibacillus phyllosphaerae TaxID=274593 RepID=A0A7W5FRD9_9BACL|nr:SDR family NAD(P)-dependent oxidoreductase [Paenibacillus phyllosphaerae]MBB3113924.1 putative oxidoreductase [Paenibacillus phyllosphaerae]